MKKIPDQSIDLIITSPPYEDISGAGYKALNKDILFFKLYSEFLDSIFNSYHRILKSTGQIFFNIKSKTHNKKLKTPHWIEFIEGFQRFCLKSYIIWKYAGSFDSSNSRLHLDYEIIYHLSKTDDIYLNDKYNDKDPLTSVWYIPHNIKNRRHPTQMPLKVVDRILNIASKKGDVILDNFAGSGTTCVAAKKRGLHYIGIELNPEYYEMMKERLKKYDNLEQFIENKTI